MRGWVAAELVLGTAIGVEKVVLQSQASAEAAAKWITQVLNGIAEAMLAIGILLGAVGTIILFLIGVLKINVMGTWGRTEGLRTLIHACETAVVVPAFIGILGLLDAMANAPGFPLGDPAQVGTPAWVIDQIWKYIVARLSAITSYLTG
ncbi:hypothetical protein B6U99_02965 [Candidatus Geothermarchaeota archaeon ex4572_27]|nr:MAG: hypothetical protein B6U99_02965 [Candidatus Geothermarchaeota archaeon ex4572_27]